MADKLLTDAARILRREAQAIERAHLRPHDGSWDDDGDAWRAYLEDARHRGATCGAGEGMTVKRPAVRYHGGKWKLAPWIIAHLPPHRVYVEPFGGGASVLLRKPRSYGEIYNDLDGEIVNVFRVLRDRGDELREALSLTPFSRSEFVESYEPADEPLEQARRTILRSFQGFGGAAVFGESSGFRAKSNRRGTTPAHDWANYPLHLGGLVERLRGVVIEQRDAVEVMRAHDERETVHYVDPPYVHSTRSEKMRGTVTRKAYRHEMDDEAHHALAGALHELVGAVALSGYASPLYDSLYRGWRRIERMAHADGARDRVEVLWLNGAAAERLRNVTIELPFA